MSQVCALCKSSEHLESEDNLIICITCGVVLSEEFFQDFDENKAEIVINSNEFCNLNKLTTLMKQELINKDLRGEARKWAKQMLEHCMSHFRFSDLMRQDANTLIIQLINSSHFYRSNSKTKIILAGVCAYLEMIKFDYVITKNAVAKAIGCSVFEFGTIYKRVIKHTKISVPSHFFTIDQHITDTVSSIGFDLDEQMQIENIVFELINFQKRCCLIDSRYPINLILAASFYAWKCVKYNERWSVALHKFMIQFKIKCDLGKYVTKLVRFMIELCKSIPWITDKRRINRKTVYFYTQDLLEHPNTVLADYLKLKSIAIDEQIIQQDIRFKYERELEQHAIANVTEEDKSVNGEISLLNISDTEIDSYIRSDEEVRMLKRIRKNQSIEDQS